MFHIIWPESTKTLFALFKLSAKLQTFSGSSLHLSVTQGQLLVYYPVSSLCTGWCARHIEIEALFANIIYL